MNSRARAARINACERSIKTAERFYNCFRDERARTMSAVPRVFSLSRANKTFSPLSLSLAPPRKKEFISLSSRGCAAADTYIQCKTRAATSCLSSSRKFRYASSCTPGNFPPRVRHALLVRRVCIYEAPRELIKAENRN